MWAAQKAGLNLSHRNIRPFDEQVDIVNFDLVLTMDHFDHDEVSNSCQFIALYRCRKTWIC